jgi:hypothetical protein
VLPPDARARVDDITRLIVEKLLIEPTEQLKALPDEETQAAYTEAINRLFKLQQEEEALDTARDKPLDIARDKALGIAPDKHEDPTTLR